MGCDLGTSIPQQQAGSAFYIPAFHSPELPQCTDEKTYTRNGSPQHRATGLVGVGSQLVERLPSIHEALGVRPNTR